MTRLAAIVITYNEEKHIGECLDSLAFADERLVFDSFSTDKTIEIAHAKGAQVVQRTFDHFAGQRNAALEAVGSRVDWVLFVDADERVTPELVTQVRAVIAHETHLVGYRIPRHNYLFGKLTTGAGWYPDYQTRLLKVGEAHYDPERKVHELVILEGDEGTLKEHLTHYNYENVAQFVAKQRKYVAYDAQILLEQGIRPKPYTYVLQPMRHFWWRFVTLKGYQDGWHGLRLSAMMALYEFRKYWVLRTKMKDESENQNRGSSTK